MCGHHHQRHHHHRSVDWERPAPADDVRASDAERERVVTHLRAEAGEGRLTVDELDERIEQAYTAKTRKDLAALTADLPRQRRPRQTPRQEFGEHLRSYLSVMALLVVIWALTGMGYFWPVWPAVGWGVAVLLHAGSLRSDPRRGGTAPV